MTRNDWRSYLSQARAELDRERLLEWVTRAESAITARMLEVCDADGDNAKEHDAEIAEMRAAIEELRKIQIERLSYPDWKETLQKS